MDNMPWLTLLMVVPLVGSGLVAVLPSRSSALAKPIALAVSLLTLALGVVAERYRGRWPEWMANAAALVGLVLLGESLTVWQWLAVGCVITASAGSTRTSARKDGEEHPRRAGPVEETKRRRRR